MITLKLFFKYICALTIVILFASCVGASSQSEPISLSSNNVNLVFVVSPDLAYNTPGDIQPDTANLTPQGLNRALALGSYLKSNILGNNNVTSIYALQPASHIQNGYADMAALEFIQQFAMLNQTTIGGVSANSFPLYSSYASSIVPSIVPAGANPNFCSNCIGLNFDNAGNNNTNILSSILNSNTPGYYVFSAPWETTGALLAILKNTFGYNITVPSAFVGSNYVYTVSINPSNNSVSSKIYNSQITPSAAYPSNQVAINNSCQQALFTLTGNGYNYGGTVNQNQTIYFIRHAEAHPNGSWDDGNYIAAGQYRALALPYALGGNKLNPAPSAVYSSDPAQVIGASSLYLSYVRPSLTVQPYAIANNLPYYIAYSIDWASPSETISYFLRNGTFSNTTILVAWEHGHIQDIINEFVNNYYSTKNGNGNVTVSSGNYSVAWGSNDYDSIWTLHLDGSGNVTVNNSLCEGINSSSLPNTAPQF